MKMLLVFLFVIPINSLFALCNAERECKPRFLSVLVFDVRDTIYKQIIRDSVPALLRCAQTNKRFYTDIHRFLNKPDCAIEFVKAVAGQVGEYDELDVMNELVLHRFPVVNDPRMKELFEKRKTVIYLEKDLVSAAYYGSTDVVAENLACGANINARDSLGRTAVYMAVSNEQAFALLWLIRYGANIHIPDKRGYTPFMVALSGNGWSWSCVYILKHFGADINARTKLGESALDLAYKFNHKRTIRYLKKKKALRFLEKEPDCISCAAQ